MSGVISSGRLARFAGNAIRFNSDCAEILNAVETHFKYCVGDDGNAIADYKIAVVNETEFSATINGSVLFSHLALDQVLWNLMQDGVMRLNGAATTHLIFHAAALAHNNNGVILCGQSGSGKSSLAAWLTASGFQYLTDEVVALPIDGEEISGLCRSVVLKRGSAFIWRRWLVENQSDNFLQFKDGSAWIAPTLFNANAVRAKVVPRVLIFPRYIAGAELNVKRLNAAESLFQLLQSLVNARNFPDGGISAAARLARQVSAFNLIYSDIEGATQWIKQIA